MAKLLPELLCLSGLVLLAVALWLLHPAASLGGLGVLAMACGVGLWKANRQRKE